MMDQKIFIPPHCRYPDPDNCQNYWQCKDGCATLEDCGEGFLFSEEDNVCDNAGNVDCGDRPNEVSEFEIDYFFPLIIGDRKCFIF